MAARGARASKGAARRRKALREEAGKAWHALQIGKPAIAGMMFRKLLEAYGEDADLVSGVGLSLLRQGKPAEALEWLEKAAEQGAPYEALVNLAAARLANADVKGAIAAYEQAMSLQPRGKDAIQGLATALAADGRVGEAVGVLREHAHALGRNRSLELQAGLFEEARDIENEKACLEALIQHGHEVERQQCRLAEIALELGDKDEAKARLKRVLATNPRMPDALAKLAQACNYRIADDAPLRAYLLEAWDAAGDDEPDKYVLAGAIGNMYDRDGDVDAAFAMLEHCHRLRARKSTYREASFWTRLNAIKQHFRADCFVEGGQEARSPRPIFILGMPRCGSTLTEQILAAHPEVTPLGEWAGFEVALAAFRPQGALLSLEQMSRLSGAQWSELGERYLARVRGRVPEARVTSDKSLGNVWHVGAIRNALPEAKIIHLRRHPLDTCLSIYKANIAGSLFDFAHNLGELGRYYRMYAELMAHWRAVLPAGSWLEVDYEILVSEPEATIRALLDYCELPWHENCLNFHRVKSAVRTASIMQVRSPISTRSIGGWKRYEKHLRPLIDALGPEYSTEYSVTGL